MYIIVIIHHIAAPRQRSRPLDAATDADWGLEFLFGFSSFGNNQSVQKTHLVAAIVDCSAAMLARPKEVRLDSDSKLD